MACLAPPQFDIIFVRREKGPWLAVYSARWDFQTLAEGGAVYWPSCICTANDLNLGSMTVGLRGGCLIRR